MFGVVAVFVVVVILGGFHRSRDELSEIRFALPVPHCLYNFSLFFITTTRLFIDLIQNLRILILINDLLYL